MKMFDKFIKKTTKTASEEVKKEVRKTIIDFIPGILAVGSMVLGIFVFRSVEDSGNSSYSDMRPTATSTRITTNNYFLGNVSDEIIKKVLEGDNDD